MLVLDALMLRKIVQRITQLDKSLAFSAWILIAALSLDCTSRPRTKGSAGFSEREWSAVASALDSIRRTAEYRDADQLAFEPRYLEAEKESDAAAIVLQDHPREAKVVKSCPRSIQTYRDAINTLKAALRLERLLYEGNNPKTKPGPHEFDKSDEKRKQQITMDAKEVDSCIAAIASYLQ